MATRQLPRKLLVVFLTIPCLLCAQVTIKERIELTPPKFTKQPTIQTASVEKLHVEVSCPGFPVRIGLGDYNPNSRYGDGFVSIDTCENLGMIYYQFCCSYVPYNTVQTAVLHYISRIGSTVLEDVEKTYTVSQSPYWEGGTALVMPFFGLSIGKSGDVCEGGLGWVSLKPEQYNATCGRAYVFWKDQAMISITRGNALGYLSRDYSTNEGNSISMYISNWTGVAFMANDNVLPEEAQQDTVSLQITVGNIDETVTFAVHKNTKRLNAPYNGDSLMYGEPYRYISIINKGDCDGWGHDFPPGLTYTMTVTEGQEYIHLYNGDTGQESLSISGIPGGGGVFLTCTDSEPPQSVFFTVSAQASNGDTCSGRMKLYPAGLRVIPTAKRIMLGEKYSSM